MTVIALSIGLSGIDDELVRFEGGRCGCQESYSSDLFEGDTYRHAFTYRIYVPNVWRVGRFGGIDQLNDLSTKRNTLWNSLRVYLLTNHMCIGVER